MYFSTLTCAGCRVLDVISLVHVVKYRVSATLLASIAQAVQLAGQAELNK